MPETPAGFDTALGSPQMLRLKERAIEKAVRKYGYIFPCGRREHLMDCFTMDRDAVCFWFNSPDTSTHAVLEPYPAAGDDRAEESHEQINRRERH